MYPGIPSLYTQIRGNNEVSVAREPNSSDASVFTEIRRSALRGLEPNFCSFSAFLREQRFCDCKRKSFRTRLATHEYTLGICQRRTAAPLPWSRISGRAWQSSRTRYAVGLRCVRANRPPALNAGYSGSNGSGRDRIGLPPGMSLIGNYRIEGPIFGDRGPTQRRCPMDILGYSIDVRRGMSSTQGFYSLLDNAIFYTELL